MHMNACLYTLMCIYVNISVHVYIYTYIDVLNSQNDVYIVYLCMQICICKLSMYVYNIYIIDVYNNNCTSEHISICLQTYPHTYM
jgi:hypothetical protein